jgi:hypothetical protein
MEESPSKKHRRSRHSGNIKPVRDSIEDRDKTEMLWKMVDFFWIEYHRDRRSQITSRLLIEFTKLLLEESRNKSDTLVEADSKLSEFLKIMPEEDE